MTKTNKINKYLMRASMELSGINATTLAEAIAYHFDGRGRVWPTTEDSLLWMITEIAESFELLSAKKNYVRNNPDDKEPFSKERFAEELGDVIYMAMITGMVEGVNPLDAMLNKMNNQIRKEIDKE